MDKTLFAWYKSQSHSFKVNRVFIHSKVLYHESKLTREFFEHKRFAGEKIMEWRSSSPDQNLIENLWSVVKMKVANNITAKQTCRSLKLSCQKLKLLVKKNWQTQWIIDCWQLSNHYIKMKRNQRFNIFVICSIIGVYQFLMIILPFYGSKMWLFGFAK